MGAANDNPMPTGDRLMGIGLGLGTLLIIALGALAVARNLGSF